jgi:hypothetical protein
MIEKRTYALIFLFILSIVFSSCGPSPEEIKATSVALTATAATDTPTPSLTPTQTDTPTPLPTATDTPVPSPTDLPTPFNTWESDQYPFSIKIPSNFIELAVDEGPSAMFSVWDTNEQMVIYEFDIGELNLPEPTIEAFLEDFVGQYEAEEGIEIVSADVTVNSNDLSIGIIIFDYTYQGITMIFAEVLYIHDESNVFRGFYAIFTENYPEIEPLILQSFDSLAVTE